MGAYSALARKLAVGSDLLAGIEGNPMKDIYSSSLAFSLAEAELSIIPEIEKDLIVAEGKSRIMLERELAEAIEDYQEYVTIAHEGIKEE